MTKMTGAAAVAAAAAVALLAGSAVRGDGDPRGMCNDYCVGYAPGSRTCGGTGSELYCQQNEQGDTSYTKEKKRIPVIPRWDDVNMVGRTLQLIYLRWNAITEVLKDAFKLICKDVTQIYLENNQIAVVEPGAFDGCPMLNDLRLQNNQIKTIMPGAFDGCLALGSLDLQNNQLVEIRAGVFQITFLQGKGDFTSRLSTLRLGGNPIARVEQGAFDGVPALSDGATYTLIENATLVSSSGADSVRAGLDAAAIESRLNATERAGAETERAVATILAAVARLDTTGAETDRAVAGILKAVEDSFEADYRPAPPGKPELHRRADRNGDFHVTLEENAHAVLAGFDLTKFAAQVRKLHDAGTAGGGAAAATVGGNAGKIAALEAKFSKLETENARLRSEVESLKKGG